MLVRTGKLVEKCSFSAILITHQGISKLRSLRKRVLILLRMVPSILAQSRMLRFLSVLHPRMWVASLLNTVNLYLCRLGKTQCKLIAMNLKLHRISHRCKLYNCDLCTGNHSHIKEVLSERTTTPYILNNTAFTNL